MRGLPVFIQTRKDLNNLFALAQDEKVDGAELAEMIQTLLARQYHRVPILAAGSTTIKTFFFPEIEEGDTTEDGMTVKAVTHIEDEESEEKQFAFSEITLSRKVVAETPILSVVKKVNPLVEDGFDIDEIKYILGVLTNA